MCVCVRACAGFFECIRKSTEFRFARGSLSIGFRPVEVPKMRFRHRFFRCRCMDFIETCGGPRVLICRFFEISQDRGLCRPLKLVVELRGVRSILRVEILACDHSHRQKGCLPKIRFLGIRWRATNFEASARFTARTDLNVLTQMLNPN